MSKVKFVTAEELDAITASCLNTRFYGFLGVFAGVFKIDLSIAIEVARIILENAGINQLQP